MADELCFTTNNTHDSDAHGNTTSLPVTGTDIQTPELCVICLERISDKATALPCGHDHFDFSCLGTWLHHQQVCPLCKNPVQVVRYVDGTGVSQIYHLSNQEIPQKGDQHRLRRNRRPPRSSTRNRRTEVKDPAIEFRRAVYLHHLYSKYVGNNSITGYQRVMPASFVHNEHLASRARLWIRRELAVFAFLNPNSPSFGRQDRRASNAEYLLEYIVAILKSIDLRGSAGQADELIQEYLGRQNTKLFLHELENWLRSPFSSLAEWDNAVQYDQHDDV